MKKGIRLAIITAMFAAVMSGCGKKDKGVSDDFKDVQGTIDSATQSDDTIDNENVSYDEDGFEIPEYEIVDLPVDATVKYGEDKKADLHFDLQEWPSDIGGAISATKKKFDEAAVNDLVNKIYDDGQFKNITDGASAGQLLVETTYQQGDKVSSNVICDLLGQIDGKDYEFYYYGSVDSTAERGDSWSLMRYDMNLGMAWYSMDVNTKEAAGENVCNKNEALQTAENYISSWGYKGYECVDCLDLANAYDESVKADGYMFSFRKKIGTSLGLAYDANCFYDSKNPNPGFFEKIDIYITSDGLVYADVLDMYEPGTDKKDATLLSKDEAIEKGTAAIENYLQTNEDNYIIYEYEYKSVWNVKVDLAYVPIGTEDGVEYRAMYIFSLEDTEFSTNQPLVAIDAVDGTVYEVNYGYFSDDFVGAKG